MFAIMLVPLVVNIFARKLLAPVEILGGIFHIIFVPAILVPLVLLAPRNPSSFVWDGFISGISGWKNDGVIWSLGLLSVTFPLGSKLSILKDIGISDTDNKSTGFDGVLHMSEETKNAAINIPRAMVYSTIVNGIIAFGFTVAVLYTMGNVFLILTSPTGSPIIQIVFQATQSKRATTVIASLILVNGIFATFSTTASVSRLIWAFARDNGLPFSSFFVKVSSHPTLSIYDTSPQNPPLTSCPHQQVSPNHKIPLRALLLTTTITLLLSLINIASTTAFAAILSLSTLALYISYALPIIFLLIKRFRGQPIPFGPFRLGRFGLPINIFAVVYAIYVIIFLPFPPQLPVTASNMNYAGPVMGIVLVFALLDWGVRGRKQFQGPTVKVMEE
jgi:choline transport protein